MSAEVKPAGGLYGQVVEAVGREIVDGVLTPGQIVYAEQLCQRFSISRSVVRESVRTLSSMGLLESRPQVGTRVLAIEQWDLLNPQIIRWRMLGPGADAQQKELLELRLGVEPVAARFAAQRMTAEVRAELLAAAGEMNVALAEGNRYAFFVADAEFHRLILEGSGNKSIAQLAGTISAALDGRSGQPSTKLNSAAVELHVSLAEALAAGDEEAAHELATLVLEQTLEESGV
jgi:DNA-binding FadR family transcriptional regulator